MPRRRDENSIRVALPTLAAREKLRRDCRKADWPSVGDYIRWVILCRDVPAATDQKRAALKAATESK